MLSFALVLCPLETVLRQAFGLDFGTTNSALACAYPDRKVEVANFGSGSTFRSILYLHEHENSRANKLRVVAGPRFKTI
jgi:molecular chaperone DnaK (HSP70)